MNVVNVFRICTAGIILVVLAPITCVNAQSINATQSVNANWKWFEGPNFDERNDSDSQTSNSAGTLNFNPGVVGLNNISSNLILSVDPAAGSIRSKTVIDIDGSNAGATAFASMDISASNQVNISDTISLDPGFLGSIRIKVKTSGSMSHSGNFTGSRGGTYVDTMTTSGSISTFASSDGETGSFQDSLNGSTGGFEPADINEYSFVNEEFLLVINEDLEFNEFDFSFSYQEDLSFTVDGLDILGFTLDQENDFMGTVELFANVYDENGSLVEGATINSAAGISYRNFSAVPEPSSLAILFPLVGLICLKRRR